MKSILTSLVLFLLSFSAFSQVTTHTDAKEVVGISGESIYSKYMIEIVGNKKDTIRVFDSARVPLPLLSEYYNLRVHRTNFKGQKMEYRIVSFNMVVTLDNDSNKVQQFYNKWMDEPLLSWFKGGRAGNVVSISEITIEDESKKPRKIGSYQLSYK